MAGYLHSITICPAISHQSQALIDSIHVVRYQQKTDLVSIEHLNEQQRLNYSVTNKTLKVSFDWLLAYFSFSAVLYSFNFIKSQAELNQVVQHKKLHKHKSQK